MLPASIAMSWGSVDGIGESLSSTILSTRVYMLRISLSVSRLHEGMVMEVWANYQRMMVGWKEKIHRRELMAAISRKGYPQRIHWKLYPLVSFGIRYFTRNVLLLRTEQRRER